MEILDLKDCLIQIQIVEVLKSQSCAMILDYLLGLRFALIEIDAILNSQLMGKYCHLMFCIFAYN